MHSRRIQSVIVTALAVATPLPGQEPVRPVRQEPIPHEVTAARQTIADHEYDISWRKRPDLPDPSSAWQAPNRAHGFRAHFTTEGLRLVPRSEPISWELGLSWVGYGRGERVVSAKRPALSPLDNRIDFNRGRLREWYVNTRRGLKQSFELSVPPEEATDAGPSPIGARPPWSARAGCESCAYLVLQLTGDLSPSFTADRQAIHFGQRLFYSALDVRDSRGQPLPAWLEGFSGGGTRGIRLVFDDSDAVYPVTIDPLITGPSWPLDGDQINGQHGVSVATAGDVNGDGYSDVIVGADSYDTAEQNGGAAYVYHGSPSGPVLADSWVLNLLNAYFGYPVATAGDVNGDGFSDVLVASTRYPGPATNGGAVFLFYGSESGLQFEAYFALDVENARLGSGLGTAGDINGDGFSDVIMGASGIDTAFIYTGSPEGLVYHSTLESDDTGAYYGRAVGTAGDVNGDGFSDVIIGGWRYTDALTEQGVVAVYHGSATGIGDHTTPLDADWFQLGDRADASWGFSVDTAGDWCGNGASGVIVGAPYYLQPPYDDELGLVRVYCGEVGIGLEATPSWEGEGETLGEHYGYSVATAGDIDGNFAPAFVIGSRAHNGSRGRVTISGQDPIDGTQVDASFGYSVAPAGDVDGDGFADVVVGEYLYDVDGLTNAGRAVVYRGTGAGIGALRNVYGLSELEVSVSGAGDVNGDGYSDVIVGAPNYDAGLAGEGLVRVYFGQASGVSATDWEATGNQAGAELGSSVGSAGDVDGDGFEDIVIGAPGYDNGASDEGAVFVFLGSETGLGDDATPADADWRAEGNEADMRLGIAVAGAGDVNGDGYGDIVVGAQSPSSERDGAFVWLGSAGGLGTEGTPDNADWSALNLASAVATAGDVNADGYSDVAVNSSPYGCVYVYLGTPSHRGLMVDPHWINCGLSGDLFGYSISSAGDVNGDGFSDLIVGAPGDFSGDAGEAYVFHGSPLGLPESWDWYESGPTSSCHFGTGVSSAGDVNGDGYSDVVISLPDCGVYPYTYFVYHGSESGLSTSPDLEGEGENFGDVEEVAGVGDVDGNGFGDFVARSTSHRRTRVYFGGGGIGRTVNPRQLQTDGSGPIPPMCASATADSFRLELTARSPFGTGSARVEWEVKSLGVELDGTGTEVSSEYSLPLSIDELASGLQHSRAQKWRVRLLNDPVTSPFAGPASRWIALPWNGQQEAKLRTFSPSNPAGRVPDQPDWPGLPLTVSRAGGDDVTLEWGPSCMTGDTDYAVYEGTLGDYDSHFAVYCGTAGLTTITYEPLLPGDRYFLIVPRNETREGSYGTDSAGVERVQGEMVCVPQEVGVCP